MDFKPNEIIFIDFQCDPADISKCFVCGNESNGNHFGVTACRACAAFFRRSVTRKKKYVCTQKQGCPIHKDSRNMCRACRFRKCERLGMDKRVIQLKREPLGARPNKSPGLPNIDTSPSSSSESLLERALRGYHYYLDQQKILYLMTYPENMMKEKIIWYAPTCVEFQNYERLCLTLHHQMLKKYFHPFGQLKNKDQVEIMMTFCYHFGRLDQSYQTAKHFTKEKGIIVALNTGQYLDSEENGEKFFKNDKDPQQSCRQSQGVMRRFKKMGQKAVRLQPTDVEIAGLSGILLWREAKTKLKDERPCQLEKQFLEELYHYCYTVHKENTSKRIWELLSLLRNVEDLMTMLRQGVTLNSIVDSHHCMIYDDIFESLVKNND